MPVISAFSCNAQNESVPKVKNGTYIKAKACNILISREREILLFEKSLR